jgi:hypothetical protein
MSRNVRRRDHAEAPARPRALLGMSVALGPCATRGHRTGRPPTAVPATADPSGSVPTAAPDHGTPSTAPALSRQPLLTSDAMLCRHPAGRRRRTRRPADRA